MLEIQENPLLLRVDSCYIPVSDPKKAAEWYVRNFGVTLWSPPGREAIVLPGRGAILVLGDGQWLFLMPALKPGSLNFETTGWEEGSSIPNDEIFEMFAITFQTTDISNLHKRLKDNNVKMTKIFNNDGCGFSFSFYDPDGNKFNVWSQVLSELVDEKLEMAETHV